MEKLIEDMMKWANVTEAELEVKVSNAYTMYSGFAG